MDENFSKQPPSYSSETVIPQENILEVSAEVGKKEPFSVVEQGGNSESSDNNENIVDVPASEETLQKAKRAREQQRHDDLKTVRKQLGHTVPESVGRESVNVGVVGGPDQDDGKRVRERIAEDGNRELKEAFSRLGAEV